MKNRIFVRERKSNAKRALGMLLYHAGLSYNKAAIFVNASYEGKKNGIEKEENCLNKLSRQRKGKE